MAGAAFFRRIAGNVEGGIQPSESVKLEADVSLSLARLTSRALVGAR